MSKSNLLIILTLLLGSVCDSYKVLVLFPFPSKSHSILGNGVVKHLLDAGHEVTFITTFPEVDRNPNLRIIDASSNFELMIDQTVNLRKIINKEMFLNPITGFINFMEIANMTINNNEQVKKILNDPSENFDVVIAEYLLTEVYTGFSALFQCPYIWFFPFEYPSLTSSLLDVSPNPAYTTNIFLTATLPYNFLQRVQSLAMQSFMFLSRSLIFSWYESKLYQKLAPYAEKRGVTLPSYDLIQNNVSLILSNTHVSMSQAASSPPNFVNIGGYHISSNVKPLPEDLKQIMDNAKHGVVYFSMGSNLKSKDYPESLKKELLEMFGSLKQVVLWKFEEQLENVPKNVHILQWAPQPSILTHPNLMVFITHGGILSTTETIHFGVPIIGIPVFGDQFTNVVRAVAKGFALKVDLSYTMVNELKDAIEEITNNTKYSKRVKELSQIYHDRPMSPGKELVHWVEHVVRTGGAPHLRSAALMVPWYQKIYLDLLAVVVGVIYLLKLVVRRMCCKKKQVELQKKKDVQIKKNK